MTPKRAHNGEQHTAVQPIAADDPTAGDVACSVLVPVLNEVAHIERSVAAMRAQRFSGGIEFLLIDGGSTDGTRELLARLAGEDPRIRVLENPQRITPAALNIGLRHARGRWVARMDAHTEYPQDYIQLGVDRLARDDTTWVSGPAIPVGSNAISRATALAFRVPFMTGGTRKWAGANDPGAAEYVLDAGVFAGVWRRETLLQVGGWDERWLANQDSEMAGRFFRRGDRLIGLPAMTAHYAPRESLCGLWRQYLRYGEYRQKTAVRHPQTMRRSHLIAPALTLTAAGAIAGPTSLRPLARAGVGCYAAALMLAAIKALPDAECPGDASLVPIVLAAMHFGHGAGFLRGSVRNGLPLAALAGAFGSHAGLQALTPPPQDVFAPALRES